tara:strand:+ start:52 stop:489 length:438 start_codon:yes stop_codon:yes gene_type:complete
MHVILANSWFPGTDYPRYNPAERRLDTVEIPDELFDRLPKSAKVMQEPVRRVPVEVEAPDPRSDPGALVDHANALAEAERKADEQRAKNKARLEQRLEDERKRALQVEAEELDRMVEEEAKAVEDEKRKAAAVKLKAKKKPTTEE